MTKTAWATQIRPILTPALAISLVLAFWLGNFYTTDFQVFLRAATGYFWQPYQAEGFFNPPWALWLFLPLAWLGSLPENLAGLGVRFVILAAFLALVRNRGGSPLAQALTLTSFPVVALLILGNIDWMLAVAMLPQVPHRWAIPLLLLKPQTGIFVILVWLKQHRDNILSLLAPTLAVLAVSVLFYGWWVDDFLLKLAALNSASWNFALLFPWLLPVGIGLGVYALLREDETTALAAMLFLSSYFSANSASVFFAVAAPRLSRRGLVLLWAASWLWFWSRGW